MSGLAVMIGSRLRVAEVGQTIRFCRLSDCVFWRGMTDHQRRWSVPPGLSLMPRLPSFAGGENVGVEGAGARLLEHVAHLFHPGVVVRGLLMFGRGGGVAIDLVEDEFCGVVLLLQEIEACYAGFFGAVFGIDGGGLLEGVDELRFDARMNDEDVHASIIGPLCLSLIHISEP